MEKVINFMSCSIKLRRGMEDGPVRNILTI